MACDEKVPIHKNVNNPTSDPEVLSGSAALALLSLNSHIIILDS